MLIEFSELNIKLLLPLIFPIFLLIEEYCKNSFIENDTQIFASFRYFLSYNFSLIFFIIYKIRIKRSPLKKKAKQKENEPEEEIVEVSDFKTINIKKYLLLALLAAIGMVCQIYRIVFENNDYGNAKYSIEVFFYLLCLSSLSYFILNQQLYKHHFVSLGIISIILIAIFIISIPFLKEVLFSFLYFFFYSFFFSIYDVLKKRYMIKYFTSPYIMMVIVGFVNSILLLIYDIITYYTNPDIGGIIIGFKDNINGVGDTFFLILDLFLECIWNIGFWITVYYFSPSYNFISEYISQFIFYIIRVIETKDDDFLSTSNVIIFIIGFVINFFFILIFNEVIILNLWGMDFNTKKNIQEREKTDSDINNMINLHSMTQQEEDFE